MPLPFLLLLAALPADTLRAPTAGGQPWHQEVAYEITARLDEPSGVLAGTQQIRYRNQSPDTLRTFSLHLHLNAFRPGSRWADADARERRVRFQRLQDPDFGFNHVRDVRIDGQPVVAEYPFAPDSTIVRFTLPVPLAPGASLEAALQWDARPSTLPRRQGRRGRAFDFAQWYPKVVVYDRFGWNEQPLVPAGEFYGEFATYRVTLDLPDDEVMGATGVPLCGDPGWARANRGSTPIDYQRTWYDTPARTLSSTVCPTVASGRKSLVWYAEQVHHFAMSMNPEYRYEAGRFNGIAVHALYQPGDEQSWGGGVAVKRTEIALAWLDQLFGRYAWPQMTNVHRIEGGGTEFPMMIHDGSADQGLIVHEAGHNYVMGHLANNEWREGWLDEGFTSFQTSWFWETVSEGRQQNYPGAERLMLNFDLDGISQPTSLPSDQYRDFSTYNTMIYARGEFFFQQLRRLVGDATMRRILRTFFERHALTHVDEAAFKAVAEEVSGRDLGVFFATNLHSTALVNYRLGRVQRTRTADGWTTRVEVQRTEPGWYPVELLVVGTDGDSARVRSRGVAEQEFLELRTRSKPREVVLDPANVSHDWNALDNYRRYFFRADDLLGGPGLRKQLFFDTHVRTPDPRDRLALGLLPTVWYNDVGGLTLGLRTRESYLGRFEQHQFLVSRGTGALRPGTSPATDAVGVFVRLRNPVRLRATHWSQTFEGFSVEGRQGARVELLRERRDHLGYGATRRRTVGLRWMNVNDAAFLPAGSQDDLGFVEAYTGAGVKDVRNGWALDGQWSATAGFTYDRPATSVTGLGVDPGYFRLELNGTARRALGRRGTFGARLHGGYADGFDGNAGTSAPTARLLNVHGATAVDRFYHPFLRSEGAILSRPDVYYHLPGGGNLRGFSPLLVTRGLVALNVEADQALLQRPRARLLQRVAVAGFADLAQPFGGRLNPAGSALLADAGIGVRALWRLGQSSVTTRIDLPLYVSAPALAQDQGPGGRRVGFRWTFSFAPSF